MMTLMIKTAIIGMNKPKKRFFNLAIFLMMDTSIILHSWCFSMCLLPSLHSCTSYFQHIKMIVFIMYTVSVQHIQIFYIWIYVFVPIEKGYTPLSKVSFLAIIQPTENGNFYSSLAFMCSIYLFILEINSASYCVGIAS